jgi:hypothetical protein
MEKNLLEILGKKKVKVQGIRNLRATLFYWNSKSTQMI